MVIYNHAFLVVLNGAVVYFPDSNSSHIFVIINGTYKNLGVSLRISLRLRDIINDGLEQRTHIRFRIFQRFLCKTRPCGSKYKRTVKLFIRSIQIHEKFQGFVNHIRRSCLRTINLIDTYDNAKVQFQGFLKYKLRLGHWSLKGVHHKNYTVHHLKNTFHFAAKVCMAWRIDNIDFHSLIKNCRIFR